ncbi:MAG: tetratricopeptide repeat protein [Bacteroidales bacterium]|nr:tetratricopeptide repeat protein [Bacteroidales bacterium]
MKEFYLLLIFITLFVSCTNENSTKIQKTGHEKPMNAELAEINKQIQQDSTNPSLYVAQSQFYIKNGNLEDALSSLQKAVNIDSLNFVAWDNLVDIYMLTNRYIDCETAMYHLLSLDPQNVSTLLKLAKYFLVIKNYDESQKYTQKVLEIDPKNAQAYYVLGTNFIEQGDTNIAIKNFIQSTELDPNFYDSQLHLAGIYEIRSNPLAAEYYKNAIRIRPKHLPTQYCLGMFYQEKLHQPERSLTIYNTILQQDSTFVTAIYNIGYIYLQYLHNPQKALPYFQKAVHLHPNYVEALYNVGCCYELMEQTQTAKSFYKQALSYNPEFSLAEERLKVVGN